MSSKRYKITVRGTEYDVEVGDLNTSPIKVYVDGEEFEVENSGELREASGLVQGSTKPAMDVDPVLSKPKPKTVLPDDLTVRAMMPGRITKVYVAVGDFIKISDEILVMESMKMENTITSALEGQIKSVLVVEGDSVQHGQSLIELET